MRFNLKTLAPCLLAALLATPMLTTGCKSQNITVNNQQDDYRQWEHDTNRPHEDMNKRTPDEQKQYNDWQQTHPSRH